VLSLRLGVGEKLPEERPAGGVVDIVVTRPLRWSLSSPDVAASSPTGVEQRPWAADGVVSSSIIVR
jgi:hypothetical protein